MKITLDYPEEQEDIAHLLECGRAYSVLEDFKQWLCHEVDDKVYKVNGQHALDMIYEHLIMEIADANLDM